MSQCNLCTTVVLNPVCLVSQHATTSRLSRLSAVPPPLELNGTANGTNGMNGNGGFSPDVRADLSKGAPQVLSAAFRQQLTAHT